MKLVIKFIIAQAFFIGFSYFAYLIFRLTLGLSIRFQINPVGFAFEQMVLFFTLVVLYALFKRFRISVILTLVLYVLFLIGNYLKIEILGTPIFPSDFILVDDLLRTWAVWIGYTPYIALILILIIWLIFHEFKNKKQDKVHSVFILVAVFFLFSYVVAFQNEKTRLFLRDHGIKYSKNVNLIKKSVKFGFVTNFFQALLFMGKPTMPKNYSEGAIHNLIKKHDLMQASSYSDSRVEKVVILMVESFTHPARFGWKTSESATPNFDNIVSNHLSGISISPVYGGKSINAEFEILTGLTNRFTPIETTPYKEFIDEPIPSLAQSFRNNGYATGVVQAIPLKGFGYRRVYDNISIEDKVGLSRGIHKNDPSGRSVDSLVIAKNIISLLENSTKTFVFAFPNSTHQPWRLDHYPDSSLYIENEELLVKDRDKTLAYFNSLTHVDLLFGELVSYFSDKKENAMILIVGDHQPSIQNYNQMVEDPTIESDYVRLMVKKHQTALGVWTNYPIDVDFDQVLSMNLIPSFVIKGTGIKVDGFMKFMVIVAKEFSVISHIYKEKNTPYQQEVSDINKQLIEEYKLIQYDILFGGNYIFKYFNQHSASITN